MSSRAGSGPLRPPGCQLQGGKKLEVEVQGVILQFGTFHWPSCLSEAPSLIMLTAEVVGDYMHDHSG